MNDKRQKTLTFSVIFSSFGPFATGYALFMNTSATQLADFLRRSVELTVLILALIIYLKIKNNAVSASQKTQYQRLIYKISAIVLLFSALILFGLFIRAMLYPNIPSGNIYLGLAVAALGILFNGYFWMRYRRFNQEQESALMETQGKIYQAKTFVDINVVIALLSVQIFSGHWASYWIDTIGTLIIAIYLIIRSMLFFHQAQKQKSV